MIGFVIRTRNEEQYIGFAIQSVIDHFGAQTKIIIIDNESNDETLKIVQTFPRKFHNIEILHIKNTEYSPGKALNLGIENLSNQNYNIAGILSAHCEITKIEKSAINYHFNDETCFAIMGKQIPIRQGKKIKPRYIWSNFQGNKLERNIVERTLADEERFFFHNAFSFIKIDKWKKNKFDEQLSGKEDRYWAKEQILAGNYFIFDPEMECKHFWTPKGATWRE